AADGERHEAERTRRDAFADYETSLRLGRRDDARAALQRCVGAAGDDAGDYRRLLDDLEARLITGGRLQLGRRRGGTIVVCAVPVIALGRDALCDLVLRTAGVSRRHAEIEVGAVDDGARFMLRDAGSRNGTRIGGLPIAGRVPLAGTGELGLGDDLRVAYATVGDDAADHHRPVALHLTVASGVDRGVQLLAGADGERLALDPVGVAADVVFADGRPWIGQGRARDLVVAGERVGSGRVQLIRGDVVTIDGEELDVT
ncbi:MAG: FHA domain-containing protein, partial [Myxococcales bacterium]|nr:FHA domain-containing protein [Myxococcales bacterium]